MPLPGKTPNRPPNRALPGEAPRKQAAPAAPKRPEHVPTEIEDISDFNESTNILIYGDSGVGKTVLCGTAPNALIASSEPGVKAAKRMGSKARTKRLRVWQDAWDLLHDLQQDDPRYDPFDWICVDTATTLQQKHLRSIVQDEHASNPEKRDEYVPAIQDRQKWHLEFKDWIVQMIDVPRNMIFTGHAMWKEDMDGDDICLPSFQGMGYEVANYVCGQMDVVGYMATVIPEGQERPVRRILWERFPPYFAKDQFNVLGSYSDNTNMPEIISKIFGEQKG